jgi:hypothetical protein
MVELLERWRWWDLPIEAIQGLLPLLRDPDIPAVKARVEARLAHPL